MPSKPAPAASARPASADPFFEAYDRAQPAYGLCPSTELASYLSQCPTTGAALDLGAGAGRDTLTLARAGFQVTAVDASSRGLERIRQRAAAAGVADRVETVHCDIRDLRIPAGSYRTMVATTVLDHIPGEDAERIWPRITAGLAAEGALFVEVHTTDDPGSPSGTGAATDAPVSETAQWVVIYFPPRQTAADGGSRFATASAAVRRTARVDYTHGPEHLHGKATLLAVASSSGPAKSPPAWYGHPIIFPRR